MSQQTTLFVLPLASDDDVVVARRSARDLAGLLGFQSQDRIRIATAVSEIARNAVRYATGGRAVFAIEGGESAQQPMALAIHVSDNGSGISRLDDVLAGRYVSATGMGLGLVGAQRLMDESHIDTGPRGTVVRLARHLPAGTALPDAATIAQWAAKLGGPSDAASAADELRRQNRELMDMITALNERQAELSRLARELEDTNRGVMALYAELDQQAEQLRNADEMKSRFLSNMSHEFRTPLSSIRALAKLLLSGVDGVLSTEQAKQIGFIGSAANELGELVNDLLDLAKIEAGKVEVVLAPFEVADLFSALRGMFKPLMSSESVALRFEAPPACGHVVGDEAKVAQILRNFISNAIKFTPTGEVRVSCGRVAEPVPAIEFHVADTGIGIAPEHQEMVFEEFAQVSNALQRPGKGTGLGLPLCRKLAALMGGSIRLESAPGAGSCFTFVLPQPAPSTEEPTP